jgi:hypothetical protein
VRRRALLGAGVAAAALALGGAAAAVNVGLISGREEPEPTFVLPVADAAAVPDPTTPPVTVADAGPERPSATVPAGDRPGDDDRSGRRGAGHDDDDDGPGHGTDDDYDD